MATAHDIVDAIIVVPALTMLTWDETGSNTFACRENVQIGQIVITTKLLIFIT